jgi:HTH-type transcriptional regulator/antitoxin HipB
MLKEANLTQEELAEKTGTKKNYISRIERGLSDIQFSTYYRLIEIGLGKHLNVTIGQEMGQRAFFQRLRPYS